VNHYVRIHYRDGRITLERTPDGIEPEDYAHRIVSCRNVSRVELLEVSGQFYG